MIWRRNGKAFRRAAWLALFAVLLQALLPVVHHPAGMAMAGQIGSNPVLGVAQHLCLAPGSTAPSAPAKAPAHVMPPCVICAAVHAVGGFVPPSPPVVAHSLGYTRTALAAAPVFLPGRALYPRQQPRAPPALV